VTSTEFYRLTYSLIELGQQNPGVNPKSLLPNVSRQKFTEMHQTLANKNTKETLAVFEGKEVCLCFDATKIGLTSYIVACLVNANLSPPRVYCLKANIKSQADYAQFTSNLLQELKTKNTLVSTICTDGLRCQVNALIGTYKGFFSFILMNSKDYITSHVFF
jgi:hypothetical protein